jgi:hypothetical protein
MTEQPVTRYATGSGAHVAYQVLGQGPAIVIVPGFASHLEVEWEDSACRSFIRRLAAFRSEAPASLAWISLRADEIA